jgi:hypothetical protein
VKNNPKIIPANGKRYSTRTCPCFMIGFRRKFRFVASPNGRFNMKCRAMLSDFYDPVIPTGMDKVKRLLRPGLHRNEHTSRARNCSKITR